jgi:transcriptional regulator with XRE-family HTH domain
MALAQIDADMGDVEPLDVLLRRAREQAGLRQVDLAAAAHVGESTYRTWEHGIAGVPADAMPLLSAALGVRFVADDGGWRFEARDPAPEPAPAPQVVILSTAEAVEAAFKWLGVPKAGE